MEKRRTLSSTLPPGAEEFLNEGKVSKHASKQVSMVPSEGLLSITVRLPPSIVNELQRTMAERKLAKQKPFTQQEIIQEAVRGWLEENR